MLQHSAGEQECTVYGPSTTSLQQFSGRKDLKEKGLHLIWFGDKTELMPLFEKLYSCLRQNLTYAVSNVERNDTKNICLAETEKLRKLVEHCKLPDFKKKWDVSAGLRERLIR